MRYRIKQWFAVLLALMMTLTALPVTALAESAAPTEETKVEQVQALIDALPEAEEITAENRADVQAQIDAIDAAILELTGDEAAALDTTRYDSAAAALQALDNPTGDNGVEANTDPDPEPITPEQVQALIDALPDAESITADNRADVQAQIDAIDAAMAELTEDQAAALDTARYDTAIAALLALDAPSVLEQVQALIDALPEAEEITAENRADVQAQIEAIDAAVHDLTEEEAAALDTARYDAAAAALLALDDPTGDNGMEVSADPDPEPITPEQVQTLIDELPEAEEITAETRDDVQAQIDAIDAAMLALTEDQAAALDTARYDAAVAALLALDAPSALEQVQALIDALPDADTITAVNRAEVEAQLSAIDGAKQELTDDELDELDVTRYMAAVDAILALDDMAGANVPKTIATESDIEYVDQDGSTQTCSSATTVESDTTSWDSTWYVVSKDVTISDRITVTGDVNLILKDGVTLTASQGITVNQGNSLTIYGQTEGTGKLTATGVDEWYAGIGSVRGEGQVNSTTCGTITINGGIIEATGGEWGAGIGGSGAKVKINGGKVTATGGFNAAGIGGISGEQAVTITINGGTIEAHGGVEGDGAGIGAGAGSSCTVTITGGTIEAYGGEGRAENRSGGPGIGTNYGDDSTVVISGGSVKAVGGKKGAGIRGDFSTGPGSAGNAVIVCNNSGINDTSENEAGLSCLIYNSSTGEMSVYGEQTLTQELSEQFSPVTLSIEEKATLTVNDDVNVTLTGESTIAKTGTLIDNGSITNEGIVANHGAIDGQNKGSIDNKGNIKNYTKEDNSIIKDVTITGNPLCTYCKLTADALNFSASTGYTPPEIPISISNEGEELATIEKVEVKPSSDDNFEIIGAQNKTVAAGQTDTSWIIKPVADLPVGSYSGTITITYNGMEETSTAVTVTFTVSQKKIPTPTDNPSDTPTDNPPPSAPESSGSWEAGEKGWWYRYKDGTYPSNGWSLLEWQGKTSWYYFDADGYMASGWLTDADGNRYFLHDKPDGTQGYMYTGWHEIDGKWYYFSEAEGGPLGSLLVNATTPDGYQVGADGAWIQ